MGPKKEAVVEKVLLGRPGNNLKSGIVGLANVGKSTLFQAITKCSLGNPANFPYATIDPEEARVIVPDARYEWLCEQYKPKSRVPANLTVYDIAGLTRGASTGAGLGNAFLSHIRAVDAIFQVVRCFDDAEIIHVEGDVDPVRDLNIISEELRLKDIEFVEKALENLAKQTRRGGQSLEMKKLKEEEATVTKILEWLKDGKDVRKNDWSPKEVEIINPLMLLTAKPVVYLVNLSEKDYLRQKNKHLPKIAEWVKEHATGDPIIPLSICFEERLTRFETDAEVDEECKKLGTKSALPKVIVTMRNALNLGSFFTCGSDEVRQWTIRKGTKAPQAAGVIHTDFEKTFIQAVVFNYNTLKEYGDEASVKAAGKIMTKGKDYVVEDGDILLIKAGSRSKVKSSVQRALRSKFIETYPGFEPYIDEILPKKASLQAVKLPDRNTLYAIDTTPLFYQPFDGPPIPHLKLVHSFPDAIPTIGIDRGAIRFVLSGAALMAPGLTSAGGRLPAKEDALEAGDVVAVTAEGKEEVCLVGVLKMGTEDMKEKGKGVVMDAGHYLGDGLWKMNLD
ncbi:P-loop containing nucleoside triphosphate hydrolase protein [Talaromyces proteolyticus]|uniref:Obg-like ATPase 1 n=1 Tax=Talaromyces proteolyticus TaxID=1131652 RepID=A0AAD4KIL4_9EURO|nr:P-loop containing nucleoside triphosphate hydrolase protein [Talaromyces proteolyticus]KAH8693247.1 P-loop containing nucleoside triphosphate hydrolase protein [Talaromyces proteolyticus]